MARGRRHGAVRRARGAAARRPWHAGSRHPGAGRGYAVVRDRTRQSRGHRRHLRPHLEHRDAVRHRGAVAPGRRGLGRLAGGLRAGTARLPRRRLADAELRRPRPGPAAVRVAAHGDQVRRRRRGPGDAAARPGQPAISRVARLGPARHARELHDRRRPGRGPRARLAGRHRLLLRAVARRPVTVGAGPLSADRHRPGTDSGIRTGSCLRPRRTASSNRRRATPEHLAPRHRSWRGGGNGPGPGAGRPAASHVGAGERAGLRRRPA